ncbi:hypothetical protein ACJJTC_018736 [Scirpophaga incertulas]
MMFFRCELWAQFIFPDREYTSIALQTKLHNEHRMLCQKHFRDEDFTDNSKTKLLRNAVPSQNVAEMFMSINEPQPAPSRLVLRDITNSEHANTVPMEHEPAPIEKTERVKLLQAKCTKYVKKFVK